MTIEYRFPELGESIHDVEVAEVLVRCGDEIEIDQSVLEVETEKARIEIPCPHAGRVVSVHVAKGDTIQVGSILLTISARLETGSPSELQQNDTPSVPAATARSLARSEAANSEKTGAELPDFSRFGPVERKRLSRLQLGAANQLCKSWQLVPHATHHDLADITELELARQKFLQAAGAEGTKVTLTSIVIKACVQLLVEMPHFNASLDCETDEIVLKRYYHIGVAVDTQFGLTVPVIHDVDKKSILEIAEDLKRLAGKARRHKLELTELRGASFTVTNVGGIGGTSMTPIVNHPEVAILGLARARKQPEFVDGALTERLMLPLSLSFDHRVINGADAARFAARLSASLNTTRLS